MAMGHSQKPWVVLHMFTIRLVWSWLLGCEQQGVQRGPLTHNHIFDMSSFCNTPLWWWEMLWSAAPCWPVSNLPLVGPWCFAQCSCWSPQMLQGCQNLPRNKLAIYLQWPVVTRAITMVSLFIITVIGSNWRFPTTSQTDSKSKIVDLPKVFVDNEWSKRTFRHLAVGNTFTSIVTRRGQIQYIIH